MKNYLHRLLFDTIICMLLLGEIVFPQFLPMDGPSRDAIYSIEVSNGNIYVGTSANGIFKSEDDGISYTKLKNGLPEFLNVFTIHNLESKILLGGDHLYSSKDGGDSWIKNNNFPNDYGGASLFLNTDSTIIARPSHGLYISYDNGETWDVQNGNLPLDTSIIYIDWGDYDTLITPKQLHDLTIFEGILYAGTDSLGILFSENLGLTWSRLDSIQKIETGIRSIYVDESKIMAATKLGLFISTDKAKSFRQIDLGENNNFMKIFFNKGKYYATSFHGISVSDDGYSWEEINDGLIYNSIQTLEFTDKKIIAGTFKDGLYSSSLDSFYWVPTNKGFTKLGILSLEEHNSQLLAGSNYWYVYGFQEDENYWYPINPELYILEFHDLYSKDSVLFAGTSRGVYKYTSDQEWQEYSDGLPPGDVNAIVGNDSLIFAGTWGRGIYKSEDKGLSWELLYDGYPKSIKKLHLSNSGKELYAIGYGEVLYRCQKQDDGWKSTKIYFPDTYSVYDISSSDSILFAGTGKGIYTSSDKGENWTKNNNEVLENTLVNRIYNYRDFVFITSRDKIYFSNNSGDSWNLYDTGVGSDDLFFIRDMLVIDSIFYVNTKNGLFNVNLQEVLTDIINSDSNLPMTYNLEQNYPNPFNPSTIIRYSLPRSGETKIIVYDLLGREIIKLVDEYKKAGEYELKFNADNLSNGIYFYRIISKDYSETKKMVVLK